MLYPEEKGAESRYKAAAKRKVDSLHKDYANLIPAPTDYPKGKGRKPGDENYKRFLKEWLTKYRGFEA